MDFFDKLKEITEEYEKKLLDLLTEQQMKRDFPEFYIYSRYVIDFERRRAECQ